MKLGAVVMTVVWLLTTSWWCTPDAIASPDSCIVRSAGSVGDGLVQVTRWSHCGRGEVSSKPADIPIRREVDCGPHSWGTGAGRAANCSAIFARCVFSLWDRAKPNTTVKVTMELSHGSWKVVAIDCQAPVAKAGVLSPSDVRDEVERRVPRPVIGVAPPDGVTLVNTQTVLWVETAPVRSLGTVRLLGKPVSIEVRMDHVTWTFGDGEPVSSSSPGLAYSSARPCATALCPGYFGHVYRRSGPMHVTASVTWTGRYRVGSAAWRAIPGVVTGLATSTDLTVREARGVLVPDPDRK